MNSYQLSSEEPPTWNQSVIHLGHSQIYNG
jgi:hypothetical protein